MESATVPLDEVYFPSVVVCNVSPLRKSFMYSVMQNSAFMADRALVSSVWQLILVILSNTRHKGRITKLLVVVCEAGLVKVYR